MATEARETAGLIGSDKVEGTYVYDAKGEHIGSIERVMIDKRSSRWPMPCSALAASWALAATTIQSPGTPQVDTSLGGYRLNITEEQLRGAPKYSGESWDWEDRERGRRVYEYYGAPWRDY